MAVPSEPDLQLAFAWLRSSLEEHGLDVSSIEIGSLDGSLAEQLDTIERCLALDTSHFDLLISGSAPGWYVPHRRRVVYAGGDGLLPDDTPDPLPDHLTSAASVLEAARTLAEDDVSPHELAQAVRNRIDRLVFTSSLARLVAFSEHAARRFEDIGHDEPIMVSPPAPHTPLGPSNVPPRLVVLATSEFEGSDRLDLLIDAFATIDDPHAELRIVGDGPARHEFEQKTADRRVRFIGEPTTDEFDLELLRASSAVVTTADTAWSRFGSLAMRAGVPLVVTRDAGGICELVEHGVNGLLVEPTQERLAWAVRHVHSSPRTRWQLGLQAQRRGAELDDAKMIEEILDLLQSQSRPRVLTLSTYPVEPMIGGGQRRARFENRAMADRCDVTVLVNRSPAERTRRRLVEAGLVQVEIPKSDAQLSAELDMFEAMDRTPIDDITASRLAVATPAFVTELHRQLDRVDLVVGTHPYLIPVLPDDAPPIVHDSHNVEATLKAELLPDDAGGRWLLRQVEEVERIAGQRAAVVTACTEDDAEQLAQSSHDVATPVFVVGNGVDTTALPFRTADEQARARQELLALCGVASDDERPIGLFIGSWHPPNIGAARLVLQMASERPDWLFVLAGSHTSEFAGEPIPENVHLIAVFAESLLWPLLAGADVALNPMRSGGGSNLKLFDYLSVGTPIVSTATGARGLTEPERFCVIVDPSAAALADGADRALAESRSSEGRLRAERGRALVEAHFDWGILGERWSLGILEALGVTPGPRRKRLPAGRRPILAETAPPPTDPVLATIQLLGRQAQLLPPSPQEVDMDPTLRERLKRANDNRNIGRVLPPGARFAAPKKALIRVGHALTNEQVIYNEAMLEAVEQLAVSLRALETEQRELRRTVDELSAQNRALQRRLEVLE